VSYENEKKLAKLGHYRIGAIIVAIVLLLMSIVFDLDWLDWPRAIAWSTAGVVSILEGRLLSRMSRDARGAYLRAVMFFVVALLCIV
jgi:hypothetical protein